MSRFGNGECLFFVEMMLLHSFSFFVKSTESAASGQRKSYMSSSHVKIALPLPRTCVPSGTGFSALPLLRPLH